MTSIFLCYFLSSLGFFTSTQAMHQEHTSLVINSCASDSDQELTSFFEALMAGSAQIITTSDNLYYMQYSDYATPSEVYFQQLPLLADVIRLALSPSCIQKTAAQAKALQRNQPLLAQLTQQQKTILVYLRLHDFVNGSDITLDPGAQKAYQAISLLSEEDQDQALLSLERQLNTNTQNIINNRKTLIQALINQQPKLFNSYCYPKNLHLGSFIPLTRSIEQFIKTSNQSSHIAARSCSCTLV